MEAPFKQRQSKLRKILAPLQKKHPTAARKSFLDKSILDLVMWTSISPDPFNPNVKRAFDKLTADFVDWNEVRITSTNELGELLESCQLDPAHAVDIKNAAQDIFHKENRLYLDFLSASRPAEVKKYLASLQNLPKTQVSVIMALLTDGAEMPPIPPVLRFGRRVGFIADDATDNAAKLIFKKTVPASQTFSAFYAVCRHTHATCKEKGPRCSACVVRAHCDYALEKTGKKR